MVQKGAIIFCNGNALKCIMHAQRGGLHCSLNTVETKLRSWTSTGAGKRCCQINNARLNHGSCLYQCALLVLHPHSGSHSFVAARYCGQSHFKKQCFRTERILESLEQLEHAESLKTAGTTGENILDYWAPFGQTFMLFCCILQFLANHAPLTVHRVPI